MLPIRNIFRFLVGAHKPKKYSSMISITCMWSDIENAAKGRVTYKQSRTLPCIYQNGLWIPFLTGMNCVCAVYKIMDHARLLYNSLTTKDWCVTFLPWRHHWYCEAHDRESEHSTQYPGSVESLSKHKHEHLASSHLATLKRHSIRFSVGVQQPNHDNSWRLHSDWWKAGDEMYRDTELDLCPFPLLKVPMQSHWHSIIGACKCTVHREWEEHTQN